MKKGYKKKISIIASSLILGASLHAAQITLSTSQNINYALDGENDSLIIDPGVTINYTGSNGYSVVSYDMMYITTYNLNNNNDIENYGTLSSNVTTNMAGGIFYITIDTGSTILNHTSGVINVNGVNAAKGIASNTLNGTIQNDGLIISTVNRALDSNAFSLYFLAGTGNVVNNGTLKGNIAFNTSGTFTNSGKIYLPYNASASINNYTQTSAGKLYIGLSSDSSGGNIQYSQLTGNNITFDAGSTISVDVLTSSAYQNLLVGQTLTDVVSASSLLTVNGALNITDNSALLDFTYTVDGNTIDIDVIQGSTIYNAINSTYANANDDLRQLGRLLDGMNGNNDSMNPLFGELNKLSSNEEVKDAVESLAPSIFNSNIKVTNQVAQNIHSVINQRQNFNLTNGLNSGDEMFSQKNFWFKSFGSIGEQKDKNNINGFDLKSYGFGIGIDGEYKDNYNFGLGLFYTKADVDTNHIDQHSDMNIYTLLAYGNVPIYDDKTNILYQASYSWQDINSDRKIFTGERATADFNTNVFAIDLDLVRDYNLNNNWLLQPNIGIVYRYIDAPSYSEKGAGVANLKIDAYDTNQFITSVGTKAFYTIDEKSKISTNLNIGYNFNNSQNDIKASFANASSAGSFTTTGIDNGNWSYDIGLGYQRDVNEKNSFDISLNRVGEGSDFYNNIISAKYTYKF